MIAAPHPLKTDPRITTAWNEYLAAIKETTNPTSYTEVETWAWSKLQQRLTRIDMEHR